MNWSWPKKKSGIGVHKLIFTEKQNKKRSTGRERALHLKKKKKLKRRQRINQQTFLQNPCKQRKSHHYHHQRKWEYSLSEMVCLQEIYLPNNIEWQISCRLNTMRFFRRVLLFVFNSSLSIYHVWPQCNRNFWNNLISFEGVCVWMRGRERGRGRERENQCVQ